MTDEPLIGALRIQAGACENFGSPFYGALLTRMATDVEAGGPMTDLLAPLGRSPSAAVVRRGRAAAAAQRL